MPKIVRRFRSNGQEVIFRYPRMADLNDCLEYINSLVAERAYIGVKEKQTRKQESTWLKGLLKKIRQRKIVVLVVEIEGKMVGIAQAEKKLLGQSHVAKLGIGLAKKARGRHIGKWLMRSIIAEAKRVLKSRIITLTVLSCNQIAINCYIECGFRVFGVLRDGLKHYGRYVDYFYMAKYL